MHVTTPTSYSHDGVVGVKGEEWLWELSEEHLDEDGGHVRVSTLKQVHIHTWYVRVCVGDQCKAYILTAEHRFDHQEPPTYLKFWGHTHLHSAVA